MVDLIEGLLPAGVHVLSAEEFVRMFCFNLHRLALYSEGLRPVAIELYEKSIKDLFIDGSFVEQIKLYPNDIDAFIEISLQGFRAAFPSNSFNDWHGRSKRDFGIDIFACLMGVPGPTEDGETFKTNQEYWHYKFGHTRDMKPKGIVKLAVMDIIQAEVPHD
jgi:hypothetical protein